MLTTIVLPDDVPGELYRAPMPGAFDWPLKQAVKDLREREIDIVVALPTMTEIRRDAPAYARLLDDEDYPWEMWDQPVPENTGPEDEEEFLDMALDLAAELRDGINVLIHCNKGVGRSGMLAVCVLLALGTPLEDAKAAAREAGAWPESRHQERYIAWAAQELARLRDL